MFSTNQWNPQWNKSYISNHPNPYSVSLSQKKREQSQDDKIDTAGEIGDFIHLESCCYGEENYLHSDRHYCANGKVINV